MVKVKKPVCQGMAPALKNQQFKVRRNEKTFRELSLTPLERPTFPKGLWPRRLLTSKSVGSCKTHWKEVDFKVCPGL